MSGEQGNGRLELAADDPRVELLTAESELRHEQEERAEASTADLLREFLDESRQLLRTEVELAYDEVRRDLQAARRAAIAFAAALALVLPAVTVLLVTLVLACPHQVLAGALLGVALLAAAGGAALYGYRKLPLPVMAQTRTRLGVDFKVLKEQVG